MRVPLGLSQIDRNSTSSIHEPSRHIHIVIGLEKQRTCPKQTSGINNSKYGDMAQVSTRRFSAFAIYGVDQRGCF